jgi:hypothetical protein
MRLTHRLSDTHCIITSADAIGEGEERLRLSALLLENNRVVASLRRHYDASDANAIADFTDEWQRLSSVSIEKPLFPEDFTSPRCPSAPLWFPDPVVFGIGVGTPEEPRIEMIPAEPADAAELQRLAAPAHVREVFRVAGVCIREECRHWRAAADGREGEGKCSLVERVVAANQPLIDNLQKCDIRSVCRWWKQEGPAACKVCPGIVTDYGEMEQSVEKEKDVVFI